MNDYINELIKNDIRVGVITNHNKFDLDEYKALKKAAKKKDIFLLPGVELSIKQGANGKLIWNTECLVIWCQNGAKKSCK